MKSLEERILWAAKCHASEYAERLAEIGGPGVGGTELRSTPSLVRSASSEREQVEFALEFSISRTWEEAAWCYVHGHFRATIVLSSAILEMVLKAEIRRAERPAEGTLGALIGVCRRESNLGNQVLDEAELINKRRSDMLHARDVLHRPLDVVLAKGPEHWHTEVFADAVKVASAKRISIRDAHDQLLEDGYKGAMTPLTTPYRAAALANLTAVRGILDALYGTKTNAQPHDLK